MVRGHWELHQWLITQGIERPRSAVSRSLNGDVALKDLLRGIGRGFSFEAPGKHSVLGGGFKDFLFSSLPGEMIQFH